MHFWMIQNAKNKVLWTYSWWIDLILHIMLKLIVSNIRQHKQVMKDHSKVSKRHLWMIQSAKKGIFGHFLDLGLLDWLDIAYYGRSKCVPSFGNTTRSWRIIQGSKIIFEWSIEPKNKFLAIFWSLVCWIDLILHIMIVQNASQRLAMVTGHA